MVKPEGVKTLLPLMRTIGALGSAAALARCAAAEADSDAPPRCVHLRVEARMLELLWSDHTSHIMQEILNRRYV